jgi:exodeoxyribonuclease V alpha subunit
MAKFGASAVERIKENPYILCTDIWGIGFKTADDAAARQGIAKDSEYRVRAGLHYVLSEFQDQGSCGVPTAVLREKASELLGVDYDRINECLQHELDAESFVRDTIGADECYFLPAAYYAEKSIAKLLLQHAKRTPARQVKNVDFAILHAEICLGITLEDTQREAVRTALLSQVCIITGGPGTGKTTITRVILEALKAEGFEPLVLCAPTGKAAKRASEATQFEALTVHRTLQVQSDGSFKLNEDEPLDADALTCDEFSMVDIFLSHAILKALPAHCRLIIIGDVNQLRSVGPGMVLNDIIESGVVPTVRLTQVFRQAATSAIVRNAHRVNSGEMPEIGYKEGSDFCFTDISPKDPKNELEKQKTREAISKEVVRLARDMYKLGYDPIRDVQVLAPMRKGKLGVFELNVELQATLNPHPDKCIEFNGSKWGTGDKVMQLRNNYEKQVYNGDIGYILDIDVANRTVLVGFDAAPVTYKYTDLDELALAYCFTIHKSQGSEFKVVIMPIDTSHYMMLRRNLIYTAYTRAKFLFVQVGSKQALQIAVKNTDTETRWTKLREWMEEGLPPEMRRIRQPLELKAA